MITVRFPSGFSVQYNTGTTVEMWGEMIQITDQNRKLLAMAPKGSLVEWTTPCRSYNASSEYEANRMKAEITQLSKDIRSLRRKVIK